MIGTKFIKPLEPDTLTRAVTRTVTREVEEQVAYPVEREITRTEQDPVYATIKAEDGTTHQIVVGYTPKEVTETVQAIEYRTELRTVTEEVPDSKEYPNPAPNTYTKYSKAAQWCNKNGARMVDMGDYYEVQALPEPTAEEMAAAELVRAKAERAALVEKATVTVDGMTFDADEKSQNRLSRGITAALALGLGPEETTEWTLADNSSAQVTAQQMARALLAAGQYQTSVWRMPYES